MSFNKIRSWLSQGLTPSGTNPTKDTSDIANIKLSRAELGLLLEMLKYRPPQIKHLPPIVRNEIWDLYQETYTKLKEVTVK